MGIGSALSKFAKLLGGFGSKFKGLFKGLRVGLGGALGKVGAAIGKIKLPTLGKLGIVGGITGFAAGVYAGIKNGVSSAFEGGSSIVRDVFKIAGVELTESQSNMILVGIIVLFVILFVRWFVRRRK